MIVVAKPYNVMRGGGVNYTYYILTLAGSSSTQAYGETEIRTYTNIAGSGTIAATKVGDADWTWTVSE